MDTIAVLGRNVWLAIIRALDTQSLIRIRRVCKLFHELTRDETLWASRTIFMVPPIDIRDYMARHPAVGSGATIDATNLPSEYFFMCVPFIQNGRNPIRGIKNAYKQCWRCSAVNKFSRCNSCREKLCECSLTFASDNGNLAYCNDCLENSLQHCKTCDRWFTRLIVCDPCGKKVCGYCEDSIERTHPNCYVLCDCGTEAVRKDTRLKCLSCNIQLCGGCKKIFTENCDKIHLCYDCFEEKMKINL